MLEANDDHLSLVSMEVNLNFHQTLHNDMLIKIINLKKEEATLTCVQEIAEDSVTVHKNFT